VVKKVADKENGYIYIIDHQPGLTIGQLAKSVSELTGMRCTPAMIYNYEKHGLINPPERTDGGFRLFKVEDIHLVACIKRWQAQGISLREIKERAEECREESKDSLDLPNLPIDRRMRFFEAAMKVFPRKGYAATTLLDIAKEAGVSSSALYQYFRSKEDLFLALTDHLYFFDVLNRVNSALSNGKEDSQDAIRQTLIKVAEGFLETHSRNAEIIRLFIATSRNYPEVGQRYCQRLISPVEDMLERFFLRQIDKGYFRPVDAKLAVHAFFGIFLNFIVTQKLLRGEGVLLFPGEERVSNLVDIFLAGVLQEVS
jgi:TetR/AcrR family transcriptional regulator, mexJK operon transcriptional repressor